MRCGSTKECGSRLRAEVLGTPRKIRRSPHYAGRSAARVPTATRTTKQKRPAPSDNHLYRALASVPPL
ncbi:hypothetical protein NDU88_010286 [Pleurodeles waltl]|uniref:Uncharacterized protein n=1 Tax=Pleurodeles waltl TaxID=8319 RepID=A0AAV7S2U6_PLEWA|nr:hypothetical protein NDU88_010286 [Pleurodeles waltl]